MGSKEEEGQDPQALGQRPGMDKVGVSAQQDLGPSPTVPSGGLSPNGGLNGLMPIRWTWYQWLENPGPKPHTQPWLRKIESRKRLWPVAHRPLHSTATPLKVL